MGLHLKMIVKILLLSSAVLALMTMASTAPTLFALWFINLLNVVLFLMVAVFELELLPVLVPGFEKDFVLDSSSPLLLPRNSSSFRRCRNRTNKDSRIAGRRFCFLGILAVSDIAGTEPARIA